MTLLQPSSLKASHAVGGEIYYEYIGDSTGVPHHYIIFMKLYRRTAGIAFGNSETVQIQSSCYPNQNISLSGGVNLNVPLQNFSECIDSNIASSVVNYYEYSGHVVLPGICSDFRFSYSICCRNADVDNLSSAGSQSIYLETLLNNTLGNNSSPRIVSEGSKAFCIGQTVNWSQSAIEEDGDSLYYELIQPLSGYNQPIAWAPGYSTGQPITSMNGVQFNNASGDFTFQPVQPEIDVVRIRITEYRFDTIFNLSLKIGHMDRDAQIYVLNNCSANPSPVNIGGNDTAFVDTADIPCGTRFLKLYLSARIDCRSIAPDGSDFALFNSQGNLIPIVGATGYKCNGYSTRSLYIQFNEDIYYNDSVYLVTRTGTDLNTLESVCGFPVPENDSLFMVITNCTTAIGNLEYSLAELELYPNPATDVLNISRPSGEISAYSIFQVEGTLLTRGLLHSRDEAVDIAMLPAGLYFMRIGNDSYSVTQKFQKL